MADLVWVGRELDIDNAANGSSVLGDVVVHASVSFGQSGGKTDRDEEFAVDKGLEGCLAEEVDDRPLHGGRSGGVGGQLLVEGSQSGLNDEGLHDNGG
jgi:hypothetical protein